MLNSIFYPLLTVDIKNIENLQDIKPSVIEKYLETLPEKFLNLGIRVVITIVLIAIGMFFIKYVRKILKNALVRAGIESGIVTFIDSCLKVLLYIVLVLTICFNCGIDATSIVAILGSAGLTIGFALQGSLSNFVGGVLILILKPFKVGDYIVEDTKNNEGTVTEISIFYTHLRTVDNRIVVVPNGILANSSLTNVSAMPYRLLDLKINISYKSEINKARNILIDIAKEHALVLNDMPVKVFVNSLEESSVVIGYRLWVKTPDYWEARWDILEQIKNRFEKNDINIPFNQLNVHLEK